MLLSHANLDSYHDRQVGGLCGRPNKSEDSCYSFWICGALAILGGLHLIDSARVVEFVLTCQHTIAGGIAREPEATPGLH